MDETGNQCCCIHVLRVLSNMQLLQASLGVPMRISNVDKIFSQKKKYHTINKTCMAKKQEISQKKQEGKDSLLHVNLLEV